MLLALKRVTFRGVVDRHVHCFGRLPMQASKIFSQAYSSGREAHLKEQPSVSLTRRAETRLKELLLRESNAGKALRIAVDPGGCQGFQYSFSLDNATPDDQVVHAEGRFSVIVDKVSAGMLDRCEIDFVDEIVYSGFKVAQNPSATTVCSCGSSFDTDM